MYKNDRVSTTAKRCYSFKKGYLQVAIGEKEEFTQRVMAILGISHKNYFSTRLNKGISNISKEKYDNITALFNEYSINDVWEII